MYDWKKTGFHGYPFNIKFVAPDGHREAVYSVTSWDRVTNNRLKGTFNFYDPNTSPMDHWLVDVVPYLGMGN